MNFYTPKKIDDFDKLKKLIKQKRDVKKQLNRNIQKATLNYDLAEQYAPITHLQEKQTNVIKQGQEDHTRAIEDQTRAIGDQTKMLETYTIPAIKSPTPEALEEEEENATTKAINADISDMISSLLLHTNTHPQMKFFKQDFISNYTINDKPFELHDNIL